MTNTCGTHATFKNVIVVPATACSTGTANTSTKDFDAQLYPNPGNGTFSLLLPDMLPAHIIIRDLSGRTIAETDGVGTVIHSISAPPGMYLVHIQSKNYVLTKKLTVSR
jgi:hypothetical protein